MTKPKFTPDPPPYLKGMPFEKAFPLFVDWKIRQENRAEDWWPKDLEARVQALELLAPYCIGTWTIADAAYVAFGYEVISGQTLCDFSTKTYTDETPYTTNANSGRGGLSIDSDGLGLVLGGEPFECFYVYNKIAGTWTLSYTENRPGGVNEYEGFGFCVAHCDDTSILVVGCPYSDEGGATSIGQVCIYTGTTATGFTFSSAMLPPSGEQRGRGKYGSSIAISRDGQVMAIGAPGTDGTPGQTVQSVFIYDWSGSAWVYRNVIQEDDPDTGFGSHVTLSTDGEILIVGDEDHEVGSSGQVTVWDNDNGTYVKRQEIDPVNLTTESLPGRYVPDSNNKKWGRSIGLSDDNRSLTITVGWNDTFANTAQWPNVFVYKLNTSNLYEFCKLLYNSPPSGVYGATPHHKLLFNDDTQKVFIGGFESSTSTSLVIEYDFTV